VGLLLYSGPGLWSPRPRPDLPQPVARRDGQRLPGQFSAVRDPPTRHVAPGAQSSTVSSLALRVDEGLRLGGSRGAHAFDLVGDALSAAPLSLGEATAFYAWGPHSDFTGGDQPFPRVVLPGSPDVCDAGDVEPLLAVLLCSCRGLASLGLVGRLCRRDRGQPVHAFLRCAAPACRTGISDGVRLAARYCSATRGSGLGAEPSMLLPVALESVGRERHDAFLASLPRPGNHGHGKPRSLQHATRTAQWRRFGQRSTCGGGCRRAGTRVSTGLCRARNPPAVGYGGVRTECLCDPCAAGAALVRVHGCLSGNRSSPCTT